MTNLSGSVVILTNEHDLAVDPVIVALQARDRRVLRLNIEQAMAGPVLDVEMGVERQLAEPVRPYVVWWRQFWIDWNPPTLHAADEHLVTMKQWQAWISALDGSSAVWTNPSWAARRAENKIIQLRMADTIGFRLPPTLITNDAATARDFVASQGQSVVKALSAAYFNLTDRHFVYTNPLNDSLLTLAGEQWFRQPVICQRLIMAEYDYRLILVGDRDFGGRAKRSGLDWRRNPSLEWEVWEAPEELVALCRSYLAHMSLRYCAFDFLGSDDEIWFLEANQAGEWAFLERTLDLGIDSELVRQFERQLDADSGSG